MLILVTYDVNTVTPDGKKRLRSVAKKCVAHGVRVQNSVFECVLDNAQFKMFMHELEQLIDPQHDSLRFYSLGNNYQSVSCSTLNPNKIKPFEPIYGIIGAGKRAICAKNLALGGRDVQASFEPDQLFGCTGVLWRHCFGQQ